MSENRDTGCEVAPAVSDTDVRSAAREVLRAWMRSPEGDELDKVGRGAMRASATATAHLAEMAIGTSPGAEDVLAAVGRLAAKVAAPPDTGRSRWWLPGRSPPADAPFPEDVTSLIERLDRERNDGVRRVLAMKSIGTRFDRADRALEDAVRLIRALGTAIEAAARELRTDDPARAETVRRDGTAILLEREQVVLTQLAVHRQATMTLDLLRANQHTLNAALETTRTATLSAVRVATAARRATGDRAALTTDMGGGHARRMLDDALDQARAALKTMASPYG